MAKVREQVGVVLAALLLDMAIGDPPNRWHPVAWMGSLIGRLRPQMPVEGQLGPLLGGAVISWGGAGLVWSVGRILEQLPGLLRWLVEIMALKTTFSLRGLIRAANDVEQALHANNLAQARHWLGWHLVSRDTSQLDSSQIAAATIQSLAENLSDGVIAPLFFYRIGGLPAALAYRYLNTCDAMLGYRDAAREWLGKIPARTDDVLNLIPARLTALGILVSAGIKQIWSEGDWRLAGQVYWRDRGQTDSPNAGQPMSSMAGALGVELEKVGHYRLGAGGRRPITADIQAAVKVLVGATVVCLGILFLRGQRD